MALIPKNLLRTAVWGNPGKGSYIIVNLFDKFNRDRTPPYFTLEREDKDGLVSFPTVFINETAEDPTEYSFAIKYFGEWDHWELISNDKKLKPIIDKLRKERDMLIKSNAVKAIFQEVKDRERKNHFTAAKLVAERGFNSPTDRNAPRNKTKTEETYDEILNDAERLGLEGLTNND